MINEARESMLGKKRTFRVSEADARAIDECLEKEGQYAHNKDLDGLMSLYTEDALFIPPDSDLVVGKKAIRHLFEAWFSTIEGEIEWKAKAEEIIGVGEYLAIRYTCTQTYVFKDKRKGQGPRTGKPRGVALYRHTEDGWKLYWDVWNYPDKQSHN